MTDKRVRMIADARFQHEGKALRCNDEFGTDEENAKDLVSLGMAHCKPTMLEELSAELVGAAQELLPRRGTYRRRDLKSER